MNVHQIATACAAFVLCAATAQPAQAQKITPGLWETNSKMGAGSGKLQEAMAMMQQHLAGMDPEQRAKIDGMMARQGVVISGDGIVAKMCITAEMASKQQLPMQHAKGNCTYQQAPMSGNTLTYTFSCTNPQGSGDGSATFTSPTAYTSTTRVTTSVTGSSDTVNITSSGRWINADCASIKPMAP